MARKRKSMRKIREILRLHYEQKLGQRQIARGANVSQSTVHEYLQRAQAAGLNWPLGEEWDEDRLEAALLPPGQGPARPPQHPLPDRAHKASRVPADVVLVRPVPSLCR